MRNVPRNCEFTHLVELILERDVQLYKYILATNKLYLRELTNRISLFAVRFYKNKEIAEQLMLKHPIFFYFEYKTQVLHFHPSHKLRKSI